MSYTGDGTHVLKITQHDRRNFRPYAVEDEGYLDGAYDRLGQRDKSEQQFARGALDKLERNRLFVRRQQLRGRDAFQVCSAEP